MAWMTGHSMALAAVLLVFGTLNTLCIKWSDRIESAGLGADGDARLFRHPYVQVWCMFSGEACALLFYQVLRCIERYCSLERAAPAKFNLLAFLPPAVCDVVASCLMCVALTMTHASSYQMLKVSVLVFTAVLSFVFLRRRFSAVEACGVAFVVAGLVSVGAADAHASAAAPTYVTGNVTGNVTGSVTGNGNVKNKDLLTGDSLILIAQLITAGQMIYEEKALARLQVSPLQAVGLEGLFGLIVTSLLLFPLFLARPGPPVSWLPSGRWEDPLDAVTQMLNEPALLCAVFGIIISRVHFNVAGLSLTNELDATSRLVLESGRTLTVWAFSLLLGWEDFLWSRVCLQIAAFGLVLLGTCLYTGAFFQPLFRRLYGDERTLLYTIEEADRWDYPAKDPFLRRVLEALLRPHQEREATSFPEDIWCDGESETTPLVVAAVTARDP